jgi:hypothetical protein
MIANTLAVMAKPMLRRPLQLATRVNQNTRDRLDAWRAAQRPIVPVSDAIRHFIERGLDDAAQTEEAPTTS